MGEFKQIAIDEANKTKSQKDGITHTNIRIRKITKARFDACGKYGENADEILNRLIDREVQALSRHGKVARFVEDARRDPRTVRRIVDAGGNRL